MIYCKPHFKTLFAPKVAENENPEPVRPRKHEMIILENQPLELPPDVVRSSDKTDHGLEELQSLNLRQKFQMFEAGGPSEPKVELEKSSGCVKRSTSILSKLARFHSKGMNVGADDELLNMVDVENSSDEEENSEDEDYLDDENHEDIELIRAKRAQKEKPMSFKEMHDIKSRFESGHMMRKEERREERKIELQNIRSRLFMGKNAKIKEMYQQAVAESEQIITAAGKQKDLDIGDKAMSIKDKFEKGEIYEENEHLGKLDEEEMDVFERGIGKKSRSMFMELEANNEKTANRYPVHQSKSTARITPRQNEIQRSPSEVVRSGEKVDDVEIEVADVASKFKFFETYKEPAKQKKSFRITPPREGVLAVSSI